MQDITDGLFSPVLFLDSLSLRLLLIPLAYAYQAQNTATIFFKIFIIDNLL